MLVYQKENTNMQEKIVTILNEMAEYLSISQMKKLQEVILYGSRAKGTARERSDIDIAVTGVDDFDRLVELTEKLPTLYSVDLLNLDTCKNQLLLEDIKQSMSFR